MIELVRELRGAMAGEPHFARHRAGTYRVRTLDDSFAMAAQVAERCGITRLADVTQLDRLNIPVWQAIRPLSRNLTVSQGKGLSALAAKTSALMEAIELWHSERLIPVNYAAIEDMLSELRYDINDLPVVEVDKTSHIMIGWSPAVVLDNLLTTWLPTELLRLDFASTLLTIPIFKIDSTGLASGNSYIEAILHGLYEAIERDALARAEEHRNFRHVFGWNRSAVVQSLEDRCLAAGVTISVLECPSAQIPVFRVTITEGSEPAFSGSGCHLDSEVALLRAITEAAQSRLTAIAGARDDIADIAYLIRPTSGGGQGDIHARVDFGKIASRATGDLANDLRLVLDMLTSGGYRPLVVDLTRSECGIPVVFVIVPGFLRPAFRH
jgi:ribosomal protein S12 methylthiotransferase accessory factor